MRAVQAAESHVCTVLCRDLMVDGRSLDLSKYGCIKSRFSIRYICI